LSANSEPKPDLPFSAEIIDYCAKRLISLGIESDRDWLRTSEVTIFEALTLGDQTVMAAEARNKIPQSTAIWETSGFYRSALPLAVFDLRNGPFLRFDQFEFLYVKILGEGARAWLPSLFLAASASPCLDPHHRYCLLRALDMKVMSGLEA
jgi:hypothetical protein